MPGGCAVGPRAWTCQAPVSRSNHGFFSLADSSAVGLYDFQPGVCGPTGDSLGTLPVCPVPVFYGKPGRRRWGGAFKAAMSHCQLLAVAEVEAALGLMRNCPSLPAWPPRLPSSRRQVPGWLLVHLEPFQLSSCVPIRFFYNAGLKHAALIKIGCGHYSASCLKHLWQAGGTCGGTAPRRCQLCQGLRRHCNAQSTRDE